MHFPRSNRELGIGLFSAVTLIVRAKLDPILDGITECHKRRRFVNTYNVILGWLAALCEHYLLFVQNGSTHSHINCIFYSVVCCYLNHTAIFLHLGHCLVFFSVWSCNLFLTGERLTFQNIFQTVWLFMMAVLYCYLLDRYLITDFFFQDKSFAKIHLQRMHRAKIRMSWANEFKRKTRKG